MISLLCPTRGRPRLCKRMVESARATAVNELDIWLGIGGNEDALQYDTQDTKALFTADLPGVHVLNMLAGHAKGDLLMIAADDTIFTTPGWDQALLEHYNTLTNKIHVYSLLDSRDADGTPHPIITRAFMNAMGYFVPPIFLHWYVDSWVVTMAKANGCFTHLKEYLLVHDKPSDKGQGDETHNRIRRMGWHDRDSFVDKTCQHFLGNEIKRLGYVGFTSARISA